MLEEKKYQRIIILGAGGSGKSTIAKMLAKKTQIPVYHLDKEYWLPNWTRPTDDAWQEKLQHLLTNESWIMDGNYIDSLPSRLEKADLVIMLDININICKWSIFFRTLKNYFSSRKDLCSKCSDRFNKRYLAFIKWVKVFKKDYYPNLINMCLKSKGVDIKIFRTRKSAKAFINNIK